MKKASVMIKGGFGNQLFQFAFANYLRSNNFKTTINTDSFKRNINGTKRNLILPASYFGFEEQSVFSKKMFQFNNAIESNKYIRKSFTHKIFNNYKYSKEKDLPYAFKKNNVFFDGYWKDMKYIDTSYEFIRKSIQKNEIIRKGFLSRNNKVLVHVRRRDFLQNNWQLEPSFYMESFDYLNRKIKEFQFDVYTDDYDWVVSQKIFENANKIVPQSIKNYDINSGDNTNETIETFSQMLTYKHFVIGNSTFSFWAAYLNSSNDSICIVPKPWFKNHSHPVLSRDSWKIINNT